MKHLTRTALAACLAGLTACAMPQESSETAAPPPSSSGEIMVWNDLLSREQPQATDRIAYGEGDLQFSEVWVPDGDEPYPVALMIHGGCWQTDIAERDIMNWIAEDLRQRGIAVWNIEYRGVDREGGGYPGTYEDVLAATDSLMINGERYNLDLSQIVAIGHSAGGHLALWLAMRQGALPGNELTSPRPVPIRVAISQGGLPDLEAGTQREGHACGTEAPRLMLGDRPDLTSPPRMPGGSAAHQILVNAERDRVAPPAFAEAYRNAQIARDILGIEPEVVPGEGHVELIAPGTASWELQLRLIREAFAMDSRDPAIFE